MNIKIKDWYLSEGSVKYFSSAWSDSKMKQLEKTGHTVITIDVQQSASICSNRIRDALEKGELESYYPGQLITDGYVYNGAIFSDPIKYFQDWTIQTLDFIEWLKEIGCDYKWLTEDTLEHDYKTDSSQINSPTLEKLMKAIEDFEPKAQEIKKNRPGKPISKDNDIRPWLKENKFNHREAYILGIIIAEHYNQ